MAEPASPWLLLIHQLPPKPPYLRVKVWRRLQSMGAVPIKNSVYVLPNTDEAREDFEWILREIRSESGDARSAGWVSDGLTDDSSSLFTDAPGRLPALLGDRAFAQAMLPARARALSDDVRARVATTPSRASEAPRGDRKIDFAGSSRVPPRARRGSDGVRRPARRLERPRCGGAIATCGGAPGHRKGIHRPHHMRVALQTVHRPGGVLQVRRAPRLRPGCARAPLRHVRRGVHPRRRSLLVRGDAARLRARGPRAPRGGRGRARRRSQGSEVRSGGDARHRSPGRGHRVGGIR